MLSAIVNTIFYGKPPSALKALCLPVIVGGVAFASLQKSAEGAYSLKFDMTALQRGAASPAAARRGENGFPGGRRDLGAPPETRATP